MTSDGASEGTMSSPIGTAPFSSCSSLAPFFAQLSAVVGYPCLYPQCKERREHRLDLVHHVETDHTSVDKLDRTIIRDVHGNILALPPHCIYRYFPETGQPAWQVQQAVSRMVATKPGAQPRITQPVTPVPTFSPALQQQPLSPAPPRRPLSMSTPTLSQLLSTGPSVLSDISCPSPRPTMLNFQPSPGGSANLIPPLPPFATEFKRDILYPGSPTPDKTPVQSPGPPGGAIRGRTCGPSVRSGHPYKRMGSVMGMKLVTPAPSPDSGRGSESSVEDSLSRQMSPVSSSRGSLTPATISTGSSTTSSTWTEAEAEPASSQSSEQTVKSEVTVDGDENSNDSWHQREDYTFESIVAYSRARAGGRTGSARKVKEGEKPFHCPVPGCNKTYKNMQGIKYHAKSAHRQRKPYKCACNKKYVSEDRFLAHMTSCSASSLPPPLPISEERSTTSSPPSFSLSPSDMDSILSSSELNTSFSSITSETTTDAPPSIPTLPLPSLPNLFANSRFSGLGLALLNHKYPTITSLLDSS